MIAVPVVVRARTITAFVVVVIGTATSEAGLASFESPASALFCVAEATGLEAVVVVPLGVAAVVISAASDAFAVIGEPGTVAAVIMVVTPRIIIVLLVSLVLPVALTAGVSSGMVASCAFFEILFVHFVCLL